MKRFIIQLVWLMAFSSSCYSQGPWNNPLKMSWSTDGVSFTNTSIFQDSAGVPCVIRWRGDTLIAAFQWFRQPNPSPSWDRVAVKFSYDKGLSWTAPTPINITGMPTGYQRPFDPTLTVFTNDSIRIYFSSSAGMPPLGLDSTVNTYSAKSADGINYIFEPGARVDVATNKAIDPAVSFFNNLWHYAAPIGAPQQGAYHYVSPDGINFAAAIGIPSDNMHNWTGNYLVESANELRFYGSGPNIWYNSSPTGATWSGYVNTNIMGGDPGIVKIAANNYLMIYVGQPYTGVPDLGAEQPVLRVYPNPAKDIITILADRRLTGSNYFITDATGRITCSGRLVDELTAVSLKDTPPGVYIVSVGGTMVGKIMIR